MRNVRKYFFEVCFVNLFFEEFWKNIVFDKKLIDEEKNYVFNVIVEKVIENGFLKFFECKRLIKILRLYFDIIVCEWRYVYCVDVI